MDVKVCSFNLFGFLFFAFLLVSCGTEIENNFCPGVLCENADDSSSSSGSSVVYTTLLSDDFNRVNESPVASPWNLVPTGENVDLISNEIVPFALNAVDPPSALYDSNVSATNVRVSASFRVGGALYDGEMLIYIRSQSGFNADDSYYCGIDPGTFQLAIGKFNGGVDSPLGNSTGTMSYDNGDTYVLTFTAEATELSCTLSGSDNLSITATDSDFSSGYSGIGGGDNGNNVLFADDFLVETGS